MRQGGEIKSSQHLKGNKTVFKEAFRRLGGIVCIYLGNLQTLFWK